MTSPVDITNAYYLTKERGKEGLDRRRSVQKDDNQPVKRNSRSVSKPYAQWWIDITINLT